MKIVSSSIDYLINRITYISYEISAGIMGFGARLFIRYIVPIIGAVFSGAPTEYLHLQNSIEHFPSPGEFIDTIANIKCGRKNGGFTVEPVVHLNFGSVQIYQGTPYN